MTDAVMEVALSCFHLRHLWVVVGFFYQYALVIIVDLKKKITVYGFPTTDSENRYCLKCHSLCKKKFLSRITK